MPGQRRPQPGARHRAPRSPCSPRSLGKRSAPGGMQPRRFQWQRFIHRRATPPFFNGNGSSIAVRTRPFSMAPAHPSPCEPRVRALPLPGLRDGAKKNPGPCGAGVLLHRLSRVQRDGLGHQTTVVWMSLAAMLVTPISAMAPSTTASPFRSKNSTPSALVSALMSLTAVKK